MSPRHKGVVAPRGLVGSEQARKHTAHLLQSLSGACGPLEAARSMGVALARYYQLEARALQAVLGAMEPRARGRKETAESLAHKERAERKRLERELHRYQALYRTLQKSLGVSPSASAAADERGGKKKRRQRKVTRGERVARALGESPVQEVAAATADGSNRP